MLTKAIEPKICNQLQRRFSKTVTRSIRSQRSLEILPVGPTTDRKHSLQVTVLLLKLIQLVQVAEKLGAIGSHISWVSILDISPLVREEDLASSAVHVCESIGDLRELLRGKVCNKVLAPVDGLCTSEYA